MHSPLGSIWRRWDFHLHTPDSYDYDAPAVTDEKLISTLMANQVEAIVVTDHITMNPNRIRTLRRLAGDNLLVLPGIELPTIMGGDDPIHITGVFSEEADLDFLWTKISAELNLTEPEVKRKGRKNVYVQAGEAATLIRTLGGYVLIHAGTRANSLDNVPNTPSYREAFKDDVLKNTVDFLEANSADHARPLRDIVLPSAGRLLPIVMGSDNHDIGNYDGESRQCWIRGDACFATLKQVIRMPEERVCLGSKPQLLVDLDRNSTRFMDRIQVHKTAAVVPAEDWFDGTDMPLNPGMIVIIGRKGSGKSAMIELMALAGNTRDIGAFSFLSRDRFRNSKKKASAFTATLTWSDGTATPRVLSQDPRDQDPERVRFIGQDSFEKVCNDLADSSDKSFQKEIERVVFSHIPVEERLSQESLQGIVDMKATPILNRIRESRSQLHEINTSIVDLENLATKESEERATAKVKELSRLVLAHRANRPPPVPDPNSAADISRLMPGRQELEDARTEMAELATLMSKCLAEKQHVYELLTTCKNLLSAIKHLKEDVDSFISKNQESASFLGLEINDVITCTYNLQPVEERLAQLQDDLETQAAKLDVNNPQSLSHRKAELQARKLELQNQLDAPAKHHQEYLEEDRIWRERLGELVGSPDNQGSLKAALQAVKDLGTLPTRLKALRQRRHDECEAIHASLEEMKALYESLYSPVSKFILDHKSLLQGPTISFSATIRQAGFMSRFGHMIDHTRTGAFVGIEEAASHVSELLSEAEWGIAESTMQFVDCIAGELASQHRLAQLGRADGPLPLQAAATIAQQLTHDTDVVHLYDYLWGLEYLDPGYDLRFGGVSLEELSPGERGNVLLIFYLLIDRSDRPLLIDQPEGNLDNETAFLSLVPYIREARRRRQIVLVTHNPNLAVVCDADQVIHASMRKDSSCRIHYTAGAIESPQMNKYLEDVLEGTRVAFKNRDSAYFAES